MKQLNPALFAYLARACGTCRTIGCACAPCYEQAYLLASIPGMEQRIVTYMKNNR